MARKKSLKSDWDAAELAANRLVARWSGGAGTAPAAPRRAVPGADSVRRTKVLGYGRGTLRPYVTGGSRYSADAYAEDAGARAAADSRVSRALRFAGPGDRALASARSTARDYFRVPDDVARLQDASDRVTARRLREGRPLRQPFNDALPSGSSVSVGGVTYYGGSRMPGNIDPNAGPTLPRHSRTKGGATFSQVLAAADRVANNNQMRRGLLDILQRRGYKGGKDDKAWAKFNRNISQATGADLSDDEREMLGKAMTGISQRAHDDVFAANKLYRDQVANLKGLRSRADAIAALRGSQKPQQYISSDMADNSDRYMGFVRAAAGVGAAAAAATGGRGYGRSYGSSGPAVGRATLNASMSGSNGKVSGWEKASAISTGGGSDYGSISMGGAGSAGASAFRSALETSVNGDPGGLVRGFTPFGTPVFTKDRRGGYEHTSAEEKAYRRSVDKWEQESTRLLNDSIMNGGAGADYMENRRLMRAFERARYAANSRYINIMNDIREMSRLSGVRPETVSVPQQPEAPQPQQPQRSAQSDTQQGGEAVYGYDPDMLKPERREDE